LVVFDDSSAEGADKVRRRRAGTITHIHSGAYPKRFVRVIRGDVQAARRSRERKTGFEDQLEHVAAHERAVNVS
jgi:hypothetical protein